MPSLEWLVVESDQIVRGRVERVDVTTPPKGSATEVAHVTVLETLKGEPREHVTFAFRGVLPTPADVFALEQGPSQWKESGVEMLLFYKGGAPHTWIRLDGKKRSIAAHELLRWTPTYDSNTTKFFPPPARRSVSDA